MGKPTERVTRSDGPITLRKNITRRENNNLQMRTFKLKKFLLAGFLALAAFSCSGNVYFDPDKDHHTKKGFKTKTDRSFTDWLSMRFREGDYPSVGKEQAQTILAEADIKKINSRALGHISTFL